MSWWTDFRDAVETAAPVVISIAAPELAPEIGSSILGADASTAAATAAGSAVISGASTALQGGSLQDIAKSAAGGAAGSAITGAISGTPAVTNEFTGEVAYPATGATALTGSQAAGQALGRFAGQTASGLIRGQTPQQALTGGAVSSLAGYLFPGEDQSAERTLTSYGLNKLLAPSSTGTVGSTQTTQGTAAPSPTGAAVTQTQAAPGSSALGQALRTDLGAPIFGGTEDQTKNKSGWNVESLRYMGGGE